MLRRSPFPGAPALLILIALALTAGCEGYDPTTPSSAVEAERAGSVSPERALAELGTQGRYGPTARLNHLPERIIPASVAEWRAVTMCGFGVRRPHREAQPMYVIDGEISVGEESELAPDAIAAIEFMEASAATVLFGSRGMDGIVFVTTYPR